MSSVPASRPPRPDPWSDPRIVVPSAEEWAALPEAGREQVEERIIDAFADYREAMSEGTPHSRPKINAYKDLFDHFGRTGRKVFLATELAVLYPGEPAIVPDLLAVTDVPDPERERNSWRVLDEGRGIDVVIEFRNLGKKHKDLVDNVKDYARLGIAEYFSFDHRTQRLRGWRLPGAGARVYTPIVPQGGSFASRVLDLELGVADRRVRFYKDLAQIPSSEELVGRLQRLTDAYQDQLEAVERERKEAVEQLETAHASMVEALLRRLAERGLTPSDAERRELLACEDFGRILRWLDQASSVATVAELLSTNGT
jgi:Uma2 family endonuclease